jgi:hypothetical protein
MHGIRDMILPDKNLLLSSSLLGMGAELLTKFNSSHTVSSLWEKTRKSGKINSYEKFILTLDLLYLLDLVKLQDGLLRKKKHA